MALPGSLPTPYPYAPDTRSGTATGTAAKLVADSTARIWASFLIFNPSASENLWIGEAGVLATDAFVKLAPGQSLPIAASDASLYYVISDGTSTPYVVLGAKL